jgi:hypothetical protein
MVCRAKASPRIEILARTVAQPDQLCTHANLRDPLIRRRKRGDMWQHHFTLRPVFRQVNVIVAWKLVIDGPQGPQDRGFVATRGGILSDRFLQQTMHTDSVIAHGGQTEACERVVCLDEALSRPCIVHIY